MKKKLPCALLCLGLCLGSAQAVEPGFSDVKESDWFAPYVALCAEKGLMEGTGGRNFSPGGILTQAECSALALRLFMLPRGGDGSFEAAPEDAGLLTLTLSDGTVLSGYSGEENPFSGWSWHGALTVPVALPGESEEEKEAWGKAHEGPAVFHAQGKDWPGQVTCWMTPNRTWEMEFTTTEEGEAQKALSAAIQRGLLQGSIPGPDKWWRDAAYTAQQWEMEGLIFSSGPADRAFFVYTLSAVSGEMEAINTIASLPDTADTRVLAFYNAGILTGMDKYGTFDGAKTLTRSEAAAMLARVLEPSLRLTFTPAQPERRDYTLTEISLPQGWVPTYDPNNVAAGWAAIQRVENETVAEEAIYRADGTVLDLEGYSVYGFEHLTSRGDSKRFWALTHDGVSEEVQALHGLLWNIYEVDQGRFLLEQGIFDDDPAWEAAKETYLSSPPTWPQPKLDESTGLYGYVDQEGNWVIPPQYDMAGPFADGAAVVHFRDGLITAAAIDETGREILPRRYSALWYLGEGVFNYWGDLSSWEGDDWRRDCGTITMEGVETPTRTFSGYFNGGLAAHYGLVPMEYEDGNRRPWAYFNFAGEQVTEDFDWAGPIGDDGSGFVCKDNILFRIQF